ncbi:hypothetical protein KBY99_07935 [Cyanobium sp. Maggiore-St4-Cus]|uniref:hypothetical protein n=1 Tax=Cyanobium sp. Maggiore-St4-Cus TaxID=2823717 RepID=UPI0020CDC97A|nr:hypothetical protein [Cyanobium sp. Maggiore-St4-Cus]MCP9788910.1 hypothetical protein [Cyanobium sp. Maggiore-St4-Cus]
MSIASSLGIFIWLIKNPRKTTASILPDFIWAIGTTTAASIIIFTLFRMNSYWLIEGPNNDSLFYFCGQEWSVKHSLFAPTSKALNEWGCPYIGHDSTLNRSGTYTLLGWITSLSSTTKGSNIYLISGYASLITWRASKLILSTQKIKKLNAYSCLATLASSLSTGFIGALTNSNIATVVGSACLSMLTALTLHRRLDPLKRHALMATWIAIGTHFYGEILLYGGLMLLISVFIDYMQKSLAINPWKTIRSLVLSGAIILALGNIPAIQVINNIFTLSSLPKDADWHSWYLHHNTIAWIGGFINGILMWGDYPTLLQLSLSISVTLLGLLLAFKMRDLRTGIMPLFFTSTAFILYLEKTSYDYGEHKVLQLLGPSWALALSSIFLIQISLNIQRIPTARTAWLSVIGLSSILYINADFLNRANTLIRRTGGERSLTNSAIEAKDIARKGQVVYLDGSNWSGQDRFMKTNYYSLFFSMGGAKVLMPSPENTSIDVSGYRHNIQYNTLKNTKGIDWLATSKSKYKKQLFLGPIKDNVQPAWQDDNLKIYPAKSLAFSIPFSLQGARWYKCEKTFCWTQKGFTIETYGPKKQGSGILEIQFTVYDPPSTGKVYVEDENGKVLVSVAASSHKIAVRYKPGWSQFKFDCNWEPKSPKSLGQSEDDRILFLAISSIHQRLLP